MIRFSLVNVMTENAESADFSDDPSLCKFLESGEEYVNDFDKKRTTAGKVRMVKLLLNAGVSLHQLAGIRRSEKGKWFLPDSGIDFNVAHSHDLIACVISDNGAVGVDIEKHRPLDWQAYRDCFTLEEFTGVLASRRPEQFFFDLWTKKESLLKAWGEGLSTDPADAIIERETGYIKGTSKRGYYHRVLIEGYSCVICSTEPAQEVKFANDLNTDFGR